MELLASVNLAAQIGVIWFAKNRTVNQQHRRIMFTVAAASIGVMALAVAVELLFDQQSDGALVATTEAAAGGVWLLYGAIGVAVVAAVASALRQPGAMRFAWRQGRYAKYRSYRRI